MHHDSASGPRSADLAELQPPFCPITWDTLNHFGVTSASVCVLFPSDYLPAQRDVIHKPHPAQNSHGHTVPTCELSPRLLEGPASQEALTGPPPRALAWRWVLAPLGTRACRGQGTFPGPRGTARPLHENQVLTHAPD